MTSDDPAATIECSIGVREIVSGDGAVRRRLTVHCGPRSEAVEMATCAGCDRCSEVRLSGSGTPGAVLCRKLDIVPRRSAGIEQATTVRALMATHIVCVMPDVSAETVAALMVDRGTSGVPVVDEDGHPIGMITWIDLLRLHVEEARRRETLPDEADEPRKAALPLAGRTAADVMSALVFSVVESTELARAAAMMSREGFHQLPVVMGDGTIGGLLSMRDVVRWVAQTDSRSE